ncbi:MAG TPA: phosphohydrolase [Clostridiales bacterium]|nr:MAG: hypothetical protein A2Y18_05740 [Clostridiales bacterium GWD2_32_19]HCC06778.1 phosphohydrolase [Clostridiales bacterium]
MFTKIEQAIYFATKAHEGQKRKTRFVDYIAHSFSVGMILKDFGCRGEVVIAGVLHDVVEDTLYTIDDIAKMFGDEVARLVWNASESDKSLSWEERKQKTIEYIKTAPFEVKLIVCADKINNLDNSYEDHQILGEQVWNSFKRGKDEMEWYFKNVLASLKYNEENNQLFERLEKTIIEAFDSKCK